MSVEHYLEELRGEDGHDVVHLVQPLDQTRLRVEEQLVPELNLVESEHIDLDVGELGDCEVHQPGDQSVCLSRPVLGEDQQDPDGHSRVLLEIRFNYLLHRFPPLSLHRSEVIDGFCIS